jgi:type IV secretory pathway VirB2 component (pilin)
MKKIFLPIILFCLLLTVFIPFTANAVCGDGSGIVNCGCAPNGSDACTITDVFLMLVKIYNFIVFYIATPLAVIAIIIAAIMMMISAGNPNLLGMGKKIFYAAIIGLVLVFCSYLIINFVVSAIAGCPDSGAPVCSWANPF